jgi:small subunit ribosomal protein S6
LRNYELVLMLDAEVDEERVTAVMDRVRGLIGEGGEIVDEDSWGRKRLAYKSKALEAGLKLAGDVIRHLLVRQD